MSKSSKILFMMSGSIACYKACGAISKLVQEGFEVRTAVTPAALQFIGLATLEGLTGQPVFQSVFTAGRQMDHIHLARWADLMIVAPATASTLARLAHGLADDAVSCLALANNFQKPLLVAPAMNHEMHAHPATQENLKRLQQWGAILVEGDSGNLACGEYGAGRLAEPERLVNAVHTHLGRGRA